MRCSPVLVTALALSACASSKATPSASPPPSPGPRTTAAPPVARAQPRVHTPIPPEHGATTLALPAMPSFELPALEPGMHDPLELLVQGKPLLGSEVRVKGYIVWIYDCVKAVAKPRETRAQTQRRLDADPTLCERPKLFLASTKDAPANQALWVVDVPRPANKLERERLPKEELAAWPEVPKLAVGDLVVIAGTFALESPHKERNSEGLLVFSSIAPATPAAATVPPAPPAPRPAIAPSAQPPQAPAPTSEADIRASLVQSNAGTRAYQRGQQQQAADAYANAIALWPDNDVAFYGLGGVRALANDWRRAADAFAHAVAIAPSEPMYRLFHGRALYEAAVHEARLQAAAQTGQPADRAVIDFAALPVDDAIAELEQAIRLDNALWRAHFLLGRIYRDRGQLRWALDELHAALRSAPPIANPWIATLELYRRWHYDAQAAELAKLGLAQVAPNEQAALWYELGMASDSQALHAQAIEAFSHVLEAPNAVGLGVHDQALFQRGQAYFATKDRPHARADLEAFLASPNGDSFARGQAREMLNKLAR